MSLRAHCAGNRAPNRSVQEVSPEEGFGLVAFAERQALSRAETTAAAEPRGRSLAMTSESQVE